MMVVTSFETFLLKETKQIMGRLFKYRFAWIEFKGRNRNWERFLGSMVSKKCQSPPVNCSIFHLLPTIA